MVKVVNVNDGLTFEDKSSLVSLHHADCCEHHYLDFSNLTVSDFEGLDFDLESDFFEKVEGFGIRLIPTNGHPISIPGYGENNGYYSTDLHLVLSRPNQEDKIFDITECQDIEG